MRKRASKITGELEKEIASEIRAGKSVLGDGGILAQMVQRVIETALEVELEAHLEQEDKILANRRNGKIKKTIDSVFGPIEMATPRERRGTFMPQIVKKRERRLGSELAHKVLKLYAIGNSSRDISRFVRETYGAGVSPATVSKITNGIHDSIKEWQCRELEPSYPFIFMDALYFKVRVEGRVVNRAVYCVLTYNSQGVKELLGMYIGDREGAKFWLSVLSDLQSRGLKDPLIICIDNLSGFREAVYNIYPNTTVQLCIVHQIRNSTKYVSYKHLKAFMDDLKLVYKATNLTAAELAFQRFEAQWAKQYPRVIDSWKKNWDGLTQFFEFSEDIRKVIYTTNVIEGFNRQLRKFTKNKASFPSDDALMKALFLAQREITANWKKQRSNWGLTIGQLEIIFPGRVQFNSFVDTLK